MLNLNGFERRVLAPSWGCLFVPGRIKEHRHVSHLISYGHLSHLLKITQWAYQVPSVLDLNSFHADLKLYRCVRLISRHICPQNLDSIGAIIQVIFGSNVLPRIWSMGICRPLVYGHIISNMVDDMDVLDTCSRVHPRGMLHWRFNHVTCIVSMLFLIIE